MNEKMDPINQGYNLLIDSLSNSMEYFDKNEFIEFHAKKTSFTEELLSLVFDEFWKLDPKKRFMRTAKEWKTWIDDLKTRLATGQTKANEFTQPEVKEAIEKRLPEIQDRIWQELQFLVKKTELTGPTVEGLADSLIIRSCRHVADELISELKNQ